MSWHPFASDFIVQDVHYWLHKTQYPRFHNLAHGTHFTYSDKKKKKKKNLEISLGKGSVQNLEK